MAQTAKVTKLPFLDSTILRGLVFGTKVYKSHLAENIGPNRYVGRFVRMEFARSVIVPLINFFNTLSMSHMKTVEEAEKAWSHSFSMGEVKLLLALSASIFDAQKISRVDPAKKQRGLSALATTIKALNRELRLKFKDPGEDRTMCARGQQSLQAVSVEPRQARDDLNRILDEIEDVKKCRQSCKIDSFVASHSKEIGRCIKAAAALSDAKANDSARKMSDKLQLVLSDAAERSCATCTGTGDAMISVSAPRAMQLETTDRSFHLWCGAVKQDYRVHDGELKYLNGLKET